MQIKLALLDMYDGVPNLGIDNIREIIQIFKGVDCTIFDVRGKCELPGMDYDIYISSGGPGSPLEGDGVWDRAYFSLMDRLWIHNQRTKQKKFSFFICHSFQMICHQLSLGSVIKRKSESFGVFPIHMTEAGKKEKIFRGLTDPFYAADFRHWQFIQPFTDRIERMGCEILALEKIRPHVPLERAIMAMRFSPEWIGVQFHTEADPEGMLEHFTLPEKKEMMVGKKGRDKYEDMLEHLFDREKLSLTYSTILPSFLSDAIQKISQQRKLQTT